MNLTLRGKLQINRGNKKGGEKMKYKLIYKDDDGEQTQYFNTNAEAKIYVQNNHITEYELFNMAFFNNSNLERKTSIYEAEARQGRELQTKLTKITADDIIDFHFDLECNKLVIIGQGDLQALELIKMEGI
jgi:hypothetical protein